MELTPAAQASYDANVERLLENALAIPGVREIAERKAQEMFIQQYGAPVALGSVLLLGLAFAAGRASRKG